MFYPVLSVSFHPCCCTANFLRLHKPSWKECRKSGMKNSAISVMVKDRQTDFGNQKFISYRRRAVELQSRRDC